MKGKWGFLFSLSLMLFVSFLSIQKAYAGGGTINGVNCNYEVNSVILDGHYIDIKGWLYTVDESSLTHKSLAQSVSKIQEEVATSKTHGYALKVGGIYYFDIGDYYVDHTYLASVEGQWQRPYRDVGFHFRIPVEDLVNSSLTQFKLEMHFYQSGRDYYKNLAYIAPTQSYSNDYYTLNFNSSSQTSSFYPTGNMTFVRSGPSKSASPLNSEYGFGSIYNYKLFFTRYNVYSWNDGSYSGVKVLDENFCSWYQIRFSESGTSSEGRARVLASGNGRYGWLNGIFCEYATEDFTFSVTRHRSTYHFDANGGINAPSDQYKYYGKDFTFPLQQPTYKGHQFMGWSRYKETEAMYQPNQTVGGLPDVDMTFYAIWKNEMPIITAPITTDDKEVMIENNRMIIQLNDVFNAKSYATAKDQEDGDLTDKIEVIQNEVVLNQQNEAIKSGLYKVTYQVKDSGGNTATKTIEVLVNDPPIINANHRYFFVGELIDESILLKDVEALDKEDGNISQKVKVDYHLLNSQIIGQYPVIYEVTDQYHKTVQKKINVNIVSDRYDTNRLGVRYISLDYINTLSKNSKWVVNPFLKQMLLDTLQTEADIRSAHYVFKWNYKQNEEMKKLIEREEFNDVFWQYQVK